MLSPVYDDTELHKRIEAAKLPPSVLKAVQSVPVAEKILEIGNKYELLLGEIGELYKVTENLLASAISSAAFSGEVEKVLENENKKLSSQIAGDINTEIILKIREKIQQQEPGRAPQPSAPALSDTARKQPYASVGTFAPKTASPKPPAASTSAPSPRPISQPVSENAGKQPSAEGTTLKKPAGSAIPSREELLREIESGLDTELTGITPAKAAPPPANLPTGESPVTPKSVMPEMSPQKKEPSFSLPPAPRKTAVSLPPTPPMTPPVAPQAPNTPKTSWKIQPKGARYTRQDNPLSSPATPEAQNTPKPGQDPYREPIN